MARFIFSHVALVVVLFSVVYASPFGQEDQAVPATRQAQTDYMIPPPNSPESEAKAQALANAYREYRKSLGEDGADLPIIAGSQVKAWIESGSRK